MQQALSTYSSSHCGHTTGFIPQDNGIGQLFRDHGEAYTNHQNELLMDNPADPNRFTVYPDIDSYNRRSVIPESRYKNTFDKAELTPVTIDTEKLIVIHPRGE